MMAAFQNTRSKIEPSGIDRRAVGGRAELSAGRINGGGTMRAIATKRRGEEIAPRKINAPVFPSKKEAKAEFSAVILSFSDGEIATDANVSKETVKTWKKRRAFPQGQVLMMLMFNNPVVLDWVLGKLGVQRHPAYLTPEILAVAAAGLHRLSQETSPDGDAARVAIANAKRKGRQ